MYKVRRLSFHAVEQMYLNPWGFSHNKRDRMIGNDRHSGNVFLWHIKGPKQYQFLVTKAGKRRWKSWTNPGWMECIKE